MSAARRALILSLSRTPIECESFPDDCERSAPGSLRLLPGFPLEVTEGELEALKSQGLAFRVLIPLPKKEQPKPIEKVAPAKKAPTKKSPKKAPSKEQKKPLKKAEDAPGG